MIGNAPITSVIDLSVNFNVFIEIILTYFQATIKKT